MVVLNSLAGIEIGRNAIVEEGGIAALVEAIEDSSDKGEEFSVLTLLQLCIDSVRNRGMLVREGGIPPLVALSQNGTAKDKHKLNLAVLCEAGTRKKIATSPMSEQPANKRNVPEVPIASMRVKKVSETTRFETQLATAAIPPPTPRSKTAKIPYLLGQPSMYHERPSDWHECFTSFVTDKQAPGLYCLWFQEARSESRNA
nr:U-box domain-containing protein 4-like [Ipomoea batatas]